MRWTLGLVVLFLACDEPAPPKPPDDALAIKTFKTVVVGQNRAPPPPAPPAFPVPFDQPRIQYPSGSVWFGVGNPRPEPAGPLLLEVGPHAKITAIGSQDPLDLAAARTVAFDLDWGAPPEASGLSVGAVLTPVKVVGDPKHAPEWLAITWIGVPGGGRGRLAVESRALGRYKALALFGWPENRAGRDVGKRLSFTAQGASLTVRVDGAQVFHTADTGLVLQRATLHLAAWAHPDAPAHTFRLSGLRVD